MGGTFNKTCKHCGRVWELSGVNVPMRDKDKIVCKCGETLFSWNGGVVFTAKLISDPNGGETE